jgi:hypothetical protein
MHRLAAALLFLGTFAHAGSPERPSATPRPADELSLRFLPDDGAVAAGGSADALLQLGDIGASSCLGRRGASHTCTRNGTRTVKRVRLLLNSASPAARFAQLRVYLETDKPRCKVRINGVTLSSTPQLIDARAPIGKPLSYVMELEVPVDEPSGNITKAITWLAET